MAVDTRNKRMSMLGLCSEYNEALPDPDGSLAAVADREQLSFQYAGIAAAAPPVPVFSAEEYSRRRRR